jgi:DNA-binding NarL/FixJ family response regulator
MSNTQKIKILLVEDQQITREGMRVVLERNGFEVIAEASDGEMGLHLLEDLQPDLVLTDVAMPKLSGDMLIKKVREKFPQIKCLVLSYHREISLVSKLLQVGANGYLPKNADEKELKEAIYNVMAGKTIISPDLVDNFDSMQQNEYSRKSANLTNKERWVLRTLLINPGKNIAAMAAILDVSPKTVEYHLSHIYDKLGVRRGDLVSESSKWLVALNNFTDGASYS